MRTYIIECFAGAPSAPLLIVCQVQYDFLTFGVSYRTACSPRQYLHTLLSHRTNTSCPFVLLPFFWSCFKSNLAPLPLLLTQRDASWGQQETGKVLGRGLDEGWREVSSPSPAKPSLSSAPCMDKLPCFREDPTVPDERSC